MHAFAKLHTWLPILALLLSHLPAQCCVGAQDTTALSSNGRYCVEARSQNGTGPGSHGPYHFRFTTYRVGHGDQKNSELGSFVRHWDSRAHFHMEVVASSTGNGILLGCPMQDAVQFLSPDGRGLHEINCDLGQQVDSYDYLRRKIVGQKHSVRLIAKGKSSRQTELWTPLAQIVGPELQAQPWQRGKAVTHAQIDRTAQPLWPPLFSAETRWLMRMLTWSPARGEYEKKAVQDGIVELLGEPCHRGARDSLIALGLSALPAVHAQLARENGAEQRAGLLVGVAGIDARLCGHTDPRRNRELLTPVADHPDEDLRNCARGRLRALALKWRAFARRPASADCR